MGRKNRPFVGHEEAGKKGAVLLSLIKTCEAIYVDPRAYLTDVLTRIAVRSDVEKLPPHGWQQHFADEVNGRRQAVLDALAGR